MDPDVVYAIADLSKGLHTKIQRILAPSVVEIAKPADRQRRGGNIVLDYGAFEGIDSRQIAAFHAAQKSWQPSTFVYLAGLRSEMEERPFALRNFGVLDATIQTRIAFEALKSQRLSGEETTPTGLLTYFANATSPQIAPVDLGRMYAPRPYDLAHDEFARSFHLIVGDSLDDVLYAWNRVLISGRHSGRDSLWISSAHARDVDFLKLVSAFINRVFWNNDQKRVKILTYSEDAETLSNTAEALKPSLWAGCDTIRLDEGTFPKAPIRSTGQLRAGEFWAPSMTRTEQIALSEDNGRIDSGRPPFAEPSARRGGWMLDLLVECQLEEPRFANKTDWWRLPQRPWLGSLFTHGRRARIIASGHPSVEVMGSEGTIPIRVPTKSGLLHTLFNAAPGLPGEAGASPYPEPEFYIRTSQQGRSFRGLVSVFGSVTLAGRTFDDPFWREVFLKGAGFDSNRTVAQKDIVRRELAALRPDGASATDNTDEVVDSILAALHKIAPLETTFTGRQLRSIWGRHSPRHGKSTRSDKESFGDFAAGELEHLRDIRVLLQGVSVTCPVCSLVDWRPVDRLRTRLECEGCGEPFTLPAEPIWTFRLNNLIASGIAREGVLPLLEAAHGLTEMASDIALVFAPQELRESRNAEPLTDLDLILIRDGRFLIGEVKSNPDQVDAAQLALLVQVAKRLRPDTVVIAATGKAWPERVRKQIEEVGSTLAECDIKTQPLLLRWGLGNDSTSSAASVAESS